MIHLRAVDFWNCERRRSKHKRYDIRWEIGRSRNFRVPVPVRTTRRAPLINSTSLMKNQLWVNRCCSIRHSLSVLVLLSWRFDRFFDFLLFFLFLVLALKSFERRWSITATEIWIIGQKAFSSRDYKENRSAVCGQNRNGYSGDKLHCATHRDTQQIMMNFHVLLNFTILFERFMAKTNCKHHEWNMMHFSVERRKCFTIARH
jgi:hypothetical protein